MNDKLIFYQFLAAVAFIMIAVGYCFLCMFFKPVVDLTAPILSMATLLLGYYWGTSKSSADKDRTKPSP